MKIESKQKEAVAVAVKTALLKTPLSGYFFGTTKRKGLK